MCFVTLQESQETASMFQVCYAHVDASAEPDPKLPR